MERPFDGALASVAQSLAVQQRNLDSALGQITRTASENSAWSAEQAKIQREWQERQNAKAMEFNASEAAKNRDWQQMMSNTAHQREIADLKAAGLNPVLSAMNGNGAAVTSGATASGVTSAGAKGERDTSANAAIVGLLSSFLSAQTQLEAANINARTQEAVADKYVAVDALAARLTNEAAHYSVDNPNTLFGLVRSILTGVTGSDSAKDLGREFYDFVSGLWNLPINGSSSKTLPSMSRKHAKELDDMFKHYKQKKERQAVRQRIYESTYGD